MTKTSKKKGESSVAFTFKLSKPVAKIIQKQPNMTAFLELLVLAHDEHEKNMKKMISHNAKAV